MGVLKTLNRGCLSGGIRRLGVDGELLGSSPKDRILCVATFHTWAVGAGRIHVCLRFSPPPPTPVTQEP